MAADSKWCPRCRAAKPRRDFSKCSRLKDGLNYMCRACLSEYGKRRRARTDVRAKEAAATKRWYDQNREKAKAIAREYLANADRIAARTKARWPGYIKSKEADWPRFALGRKLSTARRSAKIKGVEFSITIDDLLDLFREQGGKCPISGRVFEPGHTGKHPNGISLDRIDPSKGYVMGNIRLVVWIVNCAMQEYGDRELKKLCRDIVANKEFDYGC